MRPTVVAITGSPAATYTALAEAAKAKGVPILSCYATDEPSVESNILTQCGDTSFVQKSGPLMANWAIVDSNGAANMLFVTINDFPVLKAESDAVKAELTKNCAACSFTELNVTLDDLIGGKVPAAIASQIQANDKLNYVMYSFGDLPGGVTAALQAAGLDKKVIQIGQDFSDFDLPEISAGTMKAWAADPKGYAAWLMVDSAARLATGMSPEDLMNAVVFPSRFMLVAATNPCPCGGGPPGSCDCDDGARLRYLRRLSGPLLDRFDLRVGVARPGVDDLLQSGGGESTAVAAVRVATARGAAVDLRGTLNSAIPASHLDILAPLQPDARLMLRNELERERLTGRGYHRIRRVARTIADLDGDMSAPVGQEHVAMALQLRVRLRVSVREQVA